MLISMTGFGRASAPFREKNISIELNSLNSKFSDIRLKVPQKYKNFEIKLRKLISEKSLRGKIDVNIEIKSLHGESEYTINTELFKKYYKELKKLSDELGMNNGDILQAIMRIPDITQIRDEDIDEEELNAVMDVLETALKKLTTYRIEEGKAMENDLIQRANNIQHLLKTVDPFEKERAEKIRAKLRQSLANFAGKQNVDENRFEQELIFYLEKFDITEEKVRLEQHCIYFLEVLKSEEKIKGKKLNFISQEMGREINTLGAKAYSSEIQRIVVTMKDDLEKIKEQVANII